MRHSRGFTLLELSIVLVIIGLIVGGVLVGRDLIIAAEVRSQVSQLEKYKTAVFTFKSKYVYLPGDIPEPSASSFGFIPRGPYTGQGDGNGFLEGSWGSSATLNRPVFTSGENAAFWVDLSQANLLDQAFSAATATYVVKSGVLPKDFMPAARIKGNYIRAFSVTRSDGMGNWTSAGTNYFSISPVTSFLNGNGDTNVNSMAIPPAQAYAIDIKMDDALPQTGKLTARFHSCVVSTYNVLWASGTVATAVYGTADTSATPASATTCYDNKNVTGATQVYSMSVNGGSNMNCALLWEAGF